MICYCWREFSHWRRGDSTPRSPGGSCGSRICWSSSSQQLALSLGWDFQPALQKPLAPISIRARHRLGPRRIDLAVVVGQQFRFIVADRRGVLSQIAGTEDTARQLIELLFFYRAK